jgi:hypothetical protein
MRGRLPVPDDAVATVRHRSCSGDPLSFWEYDPLRRLLIARVRPAHAAPVDLPDALDAPGRVLLCAAESPVHGSYALRDLGDGDVFAVAPARYDAVRGRFGGEPIHPDLVLGSVILVGAPRVVAAELRTLFAPRETRRE